MGYGCRTPKNSGARKRVSPRQRATVVENHPTTSGSQGIAETPYPAKPGSDANDASGGLALSSNQNITPLSGVRPAFPVGQQQGPARISTPSGT